MASNNNNNVQPSPNYDFNNYKNKSKLFDSFNGTEIKLFVKVPTGYDDYGRVSTFEIVEFANVSALSGVEQYAVEPIPAIGFSKPTGVAIGSSVVTGSMTFEALNEGFANDVKKVLKEAGLGNLSIEFDVENDYDEKPRYELSDIEEINDFPNLDLILIGVKHNNPNKKIEKQLVGVRFNKGSSGIGITQISVREQYNFLAQSMEDFRPVVGADEAPETDAEAYEEVGLFM